MTTTYLFDVREPFAVVEGTRCGDATAAAAAAAAAAPLLVSTDTVKPPQTCQPCVLFDAREPASYSSRRTSGTFSDGQG